MEYQLEKYKNKSQKHECPSCGKRTFVRYVDETGAFLNERSGRCDREESCGYHYTPKDYFQDNPTDNWQTEYREKRVQKEKPNMFIPYSLIGKNLTFGGDLNTGFSDYLYNGFPDQKKRINEVFWEFLCGQDKHNRVIFSYFDCAGNYRTGKHMKYDPATGKRTKNEEGAINWTHSILIKKGVLPENYSYKLPLFGIQQLLLEGNKNKPIAIVESEKTAIISTILMSEYVWLAAGALGWLNTEKLKPLGLRGKTITLFPDASENGTAFQKWEAVTDEAKKKGYNISVSDLLEKQCTPDQKRAGYDIADLLTLEYN